MLSTIPLFGIGIEFRPSTSSIIILVPENRGDQQTECLKKKSQSHFKKIEVLYGKNLSLISNRISFQTHK